MRIPRLWLLGLAVVIHARTASAADIPGKVVVVDGKSVQVATDSESFPVVGDELIVSVSIPGTDLLAEVASGTVTGVKGTTILAKIDHATGDVEPGQVVTIRSPRPVDRPPPQQPELLSTPFSKQDADKARTAWANYLAVPDQVTDGAGIRVTLIPPGEFLMGSRLTTKELAASLGETEDFTARIYGDEHPRHRVRITQPFYIGRQEVTVGQFRQFVRERNYRTTAETNGKGGWGYDALQHKAERSNPKYSWKYTGWTQTEDHPVVNVTWIDAREFCRWLSAKESRTYRLPTEAEWEYSCRAGTQTLYWHGDDPELLTASGNVADAAAKRHFTRWSSVIQSSDGFVFTSPVGSFRANPFGLYDTHGNVSEWCGDRFDADYYRELPDEDPPGPADDRLPYRVIRDRSWFSNSASGYRSAARFRSKPDYRNGYLGFRVAAAAVE